MVSKMTKDWHILNAWLMLDKCKAKLVTVTITALCTRNELMTATIPQNIV